MATIRPDLKYTAEHEWLDDSDSPVRIGITTVATEALGDIVYLDLPGVGTEVTAGETCGEVESTKSVSDLYAPVTGTVVEVNGEAVEDPSLVNREPFEGGWLFAVEVTEEGALLSAEEYAETAGADIAD
ncbi:glycine cleavage system protein GcvH [Georgenia wutianyii]|uniref:Glycine cleavage system H protein n=1 Tax=Georgenia wutianyii TaxID=2585135 RepID=A0ABX5VRD0_9MICO|nr:glycine cleavage system protein GcvH [Georgenia wutianyii]QDB79649.1 glycine cleavage system protein GcvH [Georgenia wutianyii]